MPTAKARPSSASKVSLYQMLDLAFGSGTTFYAAHPGMKKKSSASPASAEPTSEKRAPVKNASSDKATTTAKADVPDATSKRDDPGTFTSDQDAQLLKLKLEGNKTWKEIASALDKPVGPIKERFHELKPKTDAQLRREQDASARAEAAKAKTEQIEGGSAKAEPVTMSYADYMKTQAAKKAASAEEEEKAEPQAAEAGAAAERVQDYVLLEPDDEFSYSELVLLSNLVYRDRGGMWTRIASAFFDRTGRRIHPLDIKEKLTGELS